eukprot:SAG31_NODE_1359_length_8639_cov_3.889813_6_plen_118_part_00
MHEPHAGFTSSLQRGISDLVGTVDEIITYRSIIRETADLQASAKDVLGEDQLRRRQRAARESLYKAIKLFADVCTYFPQCNWVIWTCWTVHGPNGASVPFAQHVLAVRMLYEDNWRY